MLFVGGKEVRSYTKMIMHGHDIVMIKKYEEP